MLHWLGALQIGSWRRDQRQNNWRCRVQGRFASADLRRNSNYLNFPFPVVWGLCFFFHPLSEQREFFAEIGLTADTWEACGLEADNCTRIIQKTSSATRYLFITQMSMFSAARQIAGYSFFLSATWCKNLWYVPVPLKQNPNPPPQKKTPKKFSWYKIKIFITELKCIANPLDIKCEEKKSYSENRSYMKIVKKHKS